MCLNSLVAIFLFFRCNNIEWMHPKLPQQLSFILPLKYLQRNFAIACVQAVGALAPGACPGAGIKGRTLYN